MSPEIGEDEVDPCCLLYREHYLPDHEVGCPARDRAENPCAEVPDSGLSCSVHKIQDGRCITCGRTPEGIRANALAQFNLGRRRSARWEPGA